MPLIWRLCKQRWSNVAFSGAGAADNPGRWNSLGHKAVYCAESRSLCALEVMAHVAKKHLLAKARFVTISVEVPDALVYCPTRFPNDWSSLPYPKTARHFGDRFLATAEFPVMRIPSAVTAGEFCYLLNPLHPQFPELRIGSATLFSFDPRTLSSQAKAA